MAPALNYGRQIDGNLHVILERMTTFQRHPRLTHLAGGNADAEFAELQRMFRFKQIATNC